MTTHLQDLILRDALWAGKWTRDDFNSKVIMSLPERTPDRAYHSRAHIADQLAIVKNIMPLNNVLEIGFNLGHGSLSLFRYGNAKTVTSIDIQNDDLTKRAVDAVHRRHGNDFEFIHMDTKFPTTSFLANHSGKHDVAFIDGAHDKESVLHDISLCVTLGICSFIFDDMHPHHGEVADAIADVGFLRLIATVGCIGIAKVITSEIYLGEP